MPIPGKGGSNWGYSWTPVVGPALGGIYGGLFYQAIFEASLNLWFWLVTILIAAILLTSFRVELRKAQQHLNRVEGD
ncbi:hypothetical protein [Halobacillus amylolyticus]|uniref:hypothetical protein n=1 Tax=Halobacillus amylolyticus TaxID=2932259 RepID=UPI00273835C6|nr:hypothetical protein [Halobacillus amylolyticus]